MIKIKKMIIFIILIFIIGFAIIFFMSKFFIRKFDLEKSPKSYNFKTYDEEKEYLKYIANFVKPNKLKNFIDFDRLTLYEYSEKATGNDVIEYIEFEAYNNLIPSLFDKDRKDFDDCPVTENFKQKFKTNLYEYFKIDAEDIYCYKETNYKIAVEEYNNITRDGTPLNMVKKHYTYALDENGNIDDVVFAGMTNSN